MKKTNRRVRETPPDPDRDTMREEYDFSNAVRGATVARYRAGTNVIVLDPDVSALFPSSSSVNDALREFAGLTKRRAKARRRER